MLKKLQNKVENVAIDKISNVANVGVRKVTSKIADIMTEKIKNVDLSDLTTLDNLEKVSLKNLAYEQGMLQARNNIDWKSFYEGLQSIAEKENFVRGVNKEENKKRLFNCTGWGICGLILGIVGTVFVKRMLFPVPKYISKSDK